MTNGWLRVLRRASRQNFPFFPDWGKKSTQKSAENNAENTWGRAAPRERRAAAGISLQEPLPAPSSSASTDPILQFQHRVAGSQMFLRGLGLRPQCPLLTLTPRDARNDPGLLKKVGTLLGLSRTPPPAQLTLVASAAGGPGPRGPHACLRPVPGLQAWPAEGPPPCSLPSRWSGKWFRERHGEDVTAPSREVMLK